MSGVMDSGCWACDALADSQSAIQQFAKLRYCLAAERRARVPARSQNLKSNRPEACQQITAPKSKVKRILHNRRHELPVMVSAPDGLASAGDRKTDGQEKTGRKP